MVQTVEKEQILEQNLSLPALFFLDIDEKICYPLRQTIEEEKTMITEKKLLSNCGDCLVLDDSKDGQYQIKIQESEHFVIIFGGTAGHASFNFQHPNIAHYSKKIMEFKHYHPIRGKFWTNSAGIDMFFVIPSNKIYILPEKGYSYVQAEINGVKVSLNVSGGTTNGWTDYLGNIVHACVNMKIKDLKKIAEVAERGTSLEPIKTKELTEEDLKLWEEKASTYSKDIKKNKEKFYDMVTSGKHLKIILQNRFSDYKNGRAMEIIRGMKEIRNGNNIEWHDNKGRVKYIIARFDDCYTERRVKLNQINWLETIAEMKKDLTNIFYMI